MSTSPVITVTNNDTPAPKVHFKYIDGLRALAALYVALEHCSLNIQFGIGDKTLYLSGVLFKIHFLLYFLIFRFGHYAVDMFIVLSGFCLMLPIARSGADRLQKGFIDYMKRRARRILPPYYAVLLLSLFLAYLVPMICDITGWWHSMFPALSFGAVSSHLLLVHNFTPYVMKINAPLWSIAVEWQIYFLLPSMLWLKRKFGIFALLLVAFAAGLLPYYLLGPQTTQTYPWFIGLFALGVVTADFCFAERSSIVALRERIRFIPIAGILFVFVAFLSTLQNARFRKHPILNTFYNLFGAEWQIDVLIGLITICLLVFCFEQTRKGNTGNIILRFLNQPVLVNIGIFSYSLYLTHALTIGLVDVILKSIHLPSSLFMGVMYFLTVPLCIPVAYGFYRLFERPFMSKPAIKATSAASN